MSSIYLFILLLKILSLSFLKFLSLLKVSNKQINMIHFWFDGYLLYKSFSFFIIIAYLYWIWFLSFKCIFFSWYLSIPSSHLLCMYDLLLNFELLWMLRFFVNILFLFVEINCLSWTWYSGNRWIKCYLRQEAGLYWFGQHWDQSTGLPTTATDNPWFGWIYFWGYSFWRNTLSVHNWWNKVCGLPESRENCAWNQSWQGFFS